MKKRFRVVERGIADVIEAITNSGMQYDESGVTVDRCQAIKEMRAESEIQGRLMQAKEDAKKFL